MSKHKRIFAGALCACMLLASAGCNKNKQNTATTQAQIQTTQPTSQTQQPQLPSAEEAIVMFNEAVRQLNEAQSYTMTGSVNSTSAFGETMSNVVTSIDCAYERNAEGMATMLMNSEQRYLDMVFEHSTYYADGKYYITAIESKYFVNTNDFGDYDAAMYAKYAEDAAVNEVEVLPGNDGVGYQIYFKIPYGVYDSEGLEGFLGPYVDETLLQQPVTVRANIDNNGMLASLYLSVETTTYLGEDKNDQSVIISVTLRDYNATTVTAPTDLDTYEDRTVVGEIDGGFVDPGEIEDGSLD